MGKTSGELERERIRERNLIVISDPTRCYYCKSTGLKETDAFCSNCGFPQKGTQSEMRNFIRHITDKKRILDEQKKAVGKAKNILYGLAVLNVIAGVYLGLLADKNSPALIAGLIGAAIFLSLGLWSRTQPFPAILSGLFIFIVLNVISAIEDPSTIYQGLLLKGFIISGFIYGYKGIKDSKKLEAELETIKQAKDLDTEP